VAEWWDAFGTRWEAEFDQAVSRAASRQLTETLGRIHRLRSWQRRQTRFSRENHEWHEAELLWLEGVVLERARRHRQATSVWATLGAICHTNRSSEAWFLPNCPACAARKLGFALSWLDAALIVRGYNQGEALVLARLATQGAVVPPGPGARRRTSA
jgi:hypothetical protein